MAHSFEDDGSGLTCTKCPLGPKHKIHAVPTAVRPTLDAMPATGLHSHPSTSHAAAARLILRYGTVRHEVLAAIGNRPPGYGATDDELEAITGRSHQSLSACRNSLMNDRLIEPQPDADGQPLKRETRHGNAAIAWRVTEAGTEALRIAGSHLQRHTA